MPFTSDTARTGTQFKKGASGNPGGLKKGTKHLTTHIKNILHDEKFLQQLEDQGIDTKNSKYPLEAVLRVQLIQAIENKDIKAAELLFKYGYGSKIEIENSGEQKLIIETRQAGSTTGVQQRSRNVIEAEVTVTEVEDN